MRFVMVHTQMICSTDQYKSCTGIRVSLGENTVRALGTVIIRHCFLQKAGGKFFRGGLPAGTVLERIP